MGVRGEGCVCVCGGVTPAQGLAAVCRPRHSLAVAAVAAAVAQIAVV